MGSEPLTITLPVPKKLESAHWVALVVFAILLYSLVDFLKFVLKTRLNNDNMVIAIVIAVLLLIGLVAVYIVRSLSKEKLASPLKEKEDFRNGIATELHTILKMFVGKINYYDIPCPIWSSKTDQSKVELLGKTEFELFRRFYDAIEERNKYLISRQGFNYSELVALNNKCIKALSEAYTEMVWLRSSVPDMRDLLSKAGKEG